MSRSGLLDDSELLRFPAKGVGLKHRAQMVEWINDGNRAIVSDGNRTVDVGFVNASPPYIRTYADGVWTDNLLALLRY